MEAAHTASQVKAEHGRESILGPADELELRGLALGSELKEVRVPACPPLLTTWERRASMLPLSSRVGSCLRTSIFALIGRISRWATATVNECCSFLRGTRERRPISGSGF